MVTTSDRRVCFRSIIDSSTNRSSSPIHPQSFRSPALIVPERYLVSTLLFTLIVARYSDTVSGNLPAFRPRPLSVIYEANENSPCSECPQISPSASNDQGHSRPNSRAFPIDVYYSSGSIQKEERQRLPLPGNVACRQIDPLYRKPHEQLLPYAFKKAGALPPLRTRFSPSNPTFYLEYMRFVASTNRPDEVIRMHHLLDRQISNTFSWMLNEPLDRATYNGKPVPASALLNSAFRAPLMNIRVFVELKDVDNEPVLGKLYHLDITSSDGSPLTINRILSEIQTFLKAALPGAFWRSFSIKEKGILLSTLPRGLFLDLLCRLVGKGDQKMHEELDMYLPWVNTMDIYGRKKKFAGLSWLGKGSAGHEFALHVE